MNISIAIERLVLEGLDMAPAERVRLHASVEAELARLLSQGGLAGRWSQGGAIPRLSAPQIQLPTGGNPSELGTRIAGAVYASLNEQG